MSVVIPAYNEEKRIAGTIKKIDHYMHSKDISYELILVNDGSSDNTVEAARSVGIKCLRILENPGNRGKGYSVRSGMFHAKGNYVLFSDADLSTPIEELDKLMQYTKAGYDLVIGSRALSDSDVRLHQPLYRELMGKFFNLIVRIMIVGGIKDTQCGFKLFSRKAMDLFRFQKLNGFSFDVEIMYLANKFEYNIKEVPVVWINDEASKVSPIKDSIIMFFDLIRIRWLHFDKKK